MGKYAATLMEDDPVVSEMIASALNSLEPGVQQLLAAIRGYIDANNPEMALQMLDDLYRVIETSEELDYDAKEAIETLQNSLQAFRHEAIATSTFRAATALARRDETGKFAEEFCNGGGLQQLMDFMEDFPEDEQLMSQAMTLLNTLAENPNCIPILKQNAPVEKILKAMELHPNNEAIQLEGVQALTSLAIQDPTGKKAPHAVPIQAIKEVRPGACTHQLKRKMFNHKQAVPERSLAVFA